MREFNCDCWRSARRQSPTAGHSTSRYCRCVLRKQAVRLAARPAPPRDRNDCNGDPDAMRRFLVIPALASASPTTPSERTRRYPGINLTGFRIHPGSPSRRRLANPVCYAFVRRRITDEDLVVHRANVLSFKSNRTTIQLKPVVVVLADF